MPKLTKLSNQTFTPGQGRNGEIDEKFRGIKGRNRGYSLRSSGRTKMLSTAPCGERKRRGARLNDSVQHKPLRCFRLTLTLRASSLALFSVVIDIIDPIPVQFSCRFVHVYVSAHLPRVCPATRARARTTFTNQSLAKQILRKSAFAWLMDRACKRIASQRASQLFSSDNNVLDYLFTAGK